MKPALFLLLLVPFVQAQTPHPHRNVIIFVADGLRHGSVNPTDTPTLYAIRTQGVHFENSHSLFPTFTTANASAIATGHRLGDTGDFANLLYTGFQTFDTGNFDRGPGTTMPFVENDEYLADLDSHKNGNYLNEESLLAAARRSGFNTAAIGKVGATAIQDVTEIAPQAGHYGIPQTVIIDDSTAYNPYDPNNLVPLSIALPPSLLDRMTKLGIPLESPSRSNGFGNNSPYNNGYSGSLQRPGTLAANTVQQHWMTEVTTRAVLPMFAESGKPFVMIFWSRDPDATQHNEGDSLNQLAPGINGPSSLAAVRNADHSLHEIMAWLDAHPDVKANTDIFVTSDHGFATISRRELDRVGAHTKAESARHLYKVNGHIDTKPEYLPYGCLAIDLAWALHTPLWDPDAPAAPGSAHPYKEVHLAMDEYYHPLEEWERPSHGSGFLGPAVFKADGSDAMAIVASNGGTDLIYVPDKNAKTVTNIVKALLGLDYVSSIFVDDQYGKVPGTLPLSLIDLVGSTQMPRPAIVAAFKTFYLNPGDLMHAIELADSSLQEGQGMHGGFGREVTWNNMAAIGPDFKHGYVDKAPVANSDITPTLAAILGIKLQPKGTLEGRVIEEALAGKPDATAPKETTVLSDPDPDHDFRTVLFMQDFGGQKYFDSSCRTTLKSPPPNLCEQQ
jgi:arylsulfatase A-like enzyme